MLAHHHEVERFSLAHLAKLWRGPLSEAVNPLPESGFFLPTSSGKAALCLALADLAAQGRITSKNDNVLMPRWLGFWVYGVMRGYASPVLDPVGDLRAMVVYHQYGFAQNMAPLMDFAAERGLAVIEDCAHALGGTWQGRRLGSMGDYALFSFSKYFPCVMGGGLWVRDEAAFHRIAQRMDKVHSGWLQAWSIALKAASELFPEADARILGASYTIYGRHPHMNPLLRRLLGHDLASGANNRRRANWAALRQHLAGHGIVDDLEDDALPYVVPAHIPAQNRARVLAALEALGLKTGAYMFDRARNLLAPDFEPRIWLPVHQGLDETAMERIAGTVLDALDGGNRS